jgi:hypothetical protein
MAAMFAKAARRHRDSTSSSNQDPNQTPVSPLGQRFDLGRDNHSQQPQPLHSPISLASRPSAESVRRRTSDGLQQTRVSLQAPVLPPIPRVASRYESHANLAARKEQRAQSGQQEEAEQIAHRSPEGASVSSIPENGHPAIFPAAPQAPVLSPLEIPASTNPSHYPEITFDEPKMEATMFPKPQPAPPSDPFTAGPPMSRDFIDSRDRPYSHNVQRPPAITSSYSSPNVLPPRSATVQGLHPTGSSLASPDRPSVVSQDNARKPSSNNGTNYSGSTARPSIQSSKSASASPLQTIGTPYSETSASFPAPQLVATRPKTLGSSSTIAGVMVPTHHTNSFHKEPNKPEKRKTRLLNPMALLQRRRSGQDAVNVPNEAERRSHAQAQARQKSVAAAGVSTIPEDFDPRIRGKIVHDFNAPRPRRTFSSSDADFDGSSERNLPSADSMPAMPGTLDQYQQRQSLHSAHRSDVSSRHSRHTPIFIEHLNDEPNNDGYLNPVHAERLENKDFLKRASQQGNFASHQSTPSQESSVLPPFARRSQQLDPMQASFYRDDDSSKRSSDQSSTGKRESNASSGAAVSPIAARENSSPISPEPTEKSRRPVSDMSMLGGKFDSPLNNQYFDMRANAGETSRGFNYNVSHPVVETINEASSPVEQSGQHQSNSSPPPKAVHPALRHLMSGPTSPKPTFTDSTSARSSPALGSSVPSTPEPAVAQAAISFQSPSSPPRLVEKLASAVGHSKSALSSTPKHAASNASRFSFQLDASAAEEKALEEKHRRIASSQPARKKSMADEDAEDEDDYFDEDAMDDEDEMEAENRMHDNVGGVGNAPSFGNNVPAFQNQHRHEIPRSDASSVYEEDLPAPRRAREPTYAEHPAFREHSAVYSSKHNSMAQGSHYSSDMSAYNKDGWIPNHNRVMSDATIMTLADSDNGANSQGAPGGSFYMQPQAAGYETGASAYTANKLGFNRDSTMTVSTVQSNGGAPQLTLNSPDLQATQLSPRFGDFKFSDSPERSRPATSNDPRTMSSMSPGRDPMASPTSLPPAPVTSPMVLPSATAYAYGTNEKPESAAYHGSIGKSIRARNVSTNQNLQYAAPSESGTESTHDEMYFDDGGFSEDVQNSSGYGESINEDQFDSLDFAGGFKGMEPRGYHERHASAMTITSRDGPYPAFAMPNAGKAQLRQSQLLLDDLPLQESGGPLWEAHRDSLVDAKRLGLSDLVPPLPGPAGQEPPSSQMAAYHQALADAANRAAHDGRFERNGSVSSDRSSVYSTKESQQAADRDSASFDDKSRYSRDTDATTSNMPAQKSTSFNGNADANGSQQVADKQQSTNSNAYTLPRMSGFDFGFNFDAPSTDARASLVHDFMYNAAPSDDINAAPTDDFMTSHLEDGYEDEDDDFIAAANAEALAYDDSGFYGQEFGFYARARSDSTGSNKGQTMEAINGGFFGEDGDDPLRRQKSSREPDLTPITERSEFSARNSFINFGPASTSWGHGGVASPALARLPLSPLVSGADNPNKARASGGGYFGVFPASGSSNAQSHQQFVGASPASATNSPARPWTTSDSPVSAASSSSRGLPFMSNSASGSALGVNLAADPDATPRKPQASQAHMSSPLNDAPGTAKKVPLPAVHTHSNSNGSGNGLTHSRNHSGADSVAYVRETVSPGEENSGPPRWVLERRRTSELGVDQIVGREVVKGGWI